MMVDMRFPRSREEDTLRCVETNSVELAMEWIFSHHEEPPQEDYKIAQALSLSLGNSEALKDNVNKKGTKVSYEEKPLENPLVEDILTMCINMLQITDAIDFSMIDLIVALCSQKKG